MSKHRGWRIFKQSYADRSGETQLTGNWYLGIRMEGKERRVPLFADKAASEEAGRKIAKLAADKAAGMSPDMAMTKWLEQMPAKLRERLAVLGLLDSRRIAASKAIAVHLDDYAQALADRGNTQAHVDLTKQRITRLLVAVNVRHWSDLTAHAVQRCVAEWRKDRKAPDGETMRRGMSAQTGNYYLASLKGFARWMVNERRASESPVAGLTMFNSKTDRRHDRRALSGDELGWLVRVTEGEPDRLAMTGPERAMLYRLAVGTGLRASELRSLTRGSFRLDGPEPTVTVAAGYSKRRREDVLPVRADLAGQLKRFLATKAPAAQAFAVPEPKKVVGVFRSDLKAARAKWIQDAGGPAERKERGGTDFLAYEDAAGRFADFHSLRHSFISHLAAGGVHPKVAQTLARHSTITLTMDRYSHTMRGNEAAALSALPSLAFPGEDASKRRRKVS